LAFRKYGNLIWLDMEMSGLDPEICVPIEVATIITDSQLNVLDEGPNIVIHQPDSVLEAMDEWNTSHHGASGLTKAVQESTISCEEAESQTLAFLEKWTQAGRSPICGNSIGQDVRFLRRYMPKIASHIHYRVVDISSIKEIVGRWYGLEPPPKKEAHRALDDIRESIAELMYYRQTIFVEKPRS
jgi:oligoribonuclease